MKIGLITIYHVFNYGSVLQAYATQHILEKLGASCYIINYAYPNNWQYKRGVKRTAFFKTFIRKFFPSTKQRIFGLFRKKYYNFTKYYSCLEKLDSEDWSDFDAFVAGSDQLWNYRFTLGDPTFLLSFVPNDKKRFSLASSFAQKDISPQFVELYVRELSKFVAISVREPNAVDIIERYVGKKNKIKEILDPTLLLSRADWIEAIHRSNFTKKKPYIVYYMLAYAFEPRPYIIELLNYYRKKKQYDVIVIEGYEESYKHWMQDYTSASVECFIDIFLNADLVITSSFHGTAFALNFGIPLLSVVPAEAKDDRQSSLIKKLDVTNCLIQIGDIVEKTNPYYNVENEQRNLHSLRDDNIEWIKDNIIYG